MGGSLEAILREQQLASVGRLSAGFSHEFKNHLAVINESVGLIGDLLAAAQRKGTALDQERCLKIIKSIGERMVIAAELTGYVNRFSHRLDGKAANFSINNVMAELLALMARFARQRNLRLISSPAPACKPIHNYPALLQFVCYCLLMSIFSRVAEGGAVQVSIEQDERVRIVIRTEGVLLSGPEEKNVTDDPVLRKALDLLSAEVVTSICDNGGQETALLISSL